MAAEHHHLQKTELQNKLETLSSKKQVWRDLSASKKLSYLQNMLKNLQKIDHQSWGIDASHQQGYDHDNKHGDRLASAEQMINASILAGTIRALIRSYQSIASTGVPPAIKKKKILSDGRQINTVFPFDFADKMNPNGIAGVTAEVWTRPNTDETQKSHSASLSLVLGAGNQSFLAFGDVMHEMFIKGNVSILKHHPVRAFSAPFYDELFSELITDGYFATTQCDLAISQWLCHHDLIDAIHMTGGTATHDAIVWGGNPEIQSENKANKTPVLKKPMSSELGCITPWIICSGTNWTDKELRHHASHLAMAFVSQNSCNCLSPKLLVLDEDWPQRDIFVRYLHEELERSPLAPPYYPGTSKRYQGFQETYSDHEITMIKSQIAPAKQHHDLGEPLPWMLLHLNPTSNTYALQNEAFAPILGIYSFKGENKPETFLPKATQFVNDELWGTLSCTVLIKDSIQKTHGETIEKCIADLRYGSIAINAWTATVYGLDGCVWGAYPGESLDNVASGIGFVRNAFMLKNIEKSVLRSPFVHSAQLTLSEQGSFPLSSKQFRSLCDLILKPSFMNMMKVGWNMSFSGE